MEEVGEKGTGGLECSGAEFASNDEGVTTFDGLAFNVLRTNGVLSAIEVGYLSSGVDGRGVSFEGAANSEGDVVELGEAVILPRPVGEGDRAFAFGNTIPGAGRSCVDRRRDFICTENLEPAPTPAIPPSTAGLMAVEDGKGKVDCLAVSVARSAIRGSAETTVLVLAGLGAL
jgi:hypothetical protein